MGSTRSDTNESLNHDLPNPVHIVTDEDMAVFREECRLNPPTGPNVIISPLSDESVQGYLNDNTPCANGVREICDVVQILEGAGIPCCMVAEPALIYYGTGRVMVASTTFYFRIYWNSDIRTYRNGLCASQPSN